MKMWYAGDALMSSDLVSSSRGPSHVCKVRKVNQSVRYYANTAINSKQLMLRSYNLYHVINANGKHQSRNMYSTTD